MVIDEFQRLFEIFLSFYPTISNGAIIPMQVGLGQTGELGHHDTQDVRHLTGMAATFFKFRIRREPNGYHNRQADDLGAILERAQLIWTPDLPIKEKKDIFIADRRAASEADARRPLYVVLTRGRDRLILEWPEFALKKLGESEGPANHAEMLVLDAGMDPQKRNLKVGKVSFPAHILMCSADAPDVPETETVGCAEGTLAFGDLRPMIDSPRTAWRVRPSLIAPETPQDLQTLVVPLDVPPQTASLAATASERGTALHKALRVLLLRPDLRPRLPAATGFDDATLDFLQAQADALKTWLTAAGYTQIACEVPIQKRDASGAEFNGIIDLLATGRRTQAAASKMSARAARVCRIHTGYVLSLPCFSIRIALIAFGFSGGLIFRVTGVTVLLSLFACCLLGLGGGFGFNLVKGRLLLLFELYPCALRLPFVPGRSYRQTLLLPCKTVRFCGFPCHTVGVKASSFRICGGATAITKIVIFLVFHIFVPLTMLWFQPSDLLRRA